MRKIHEPLRVNTVRLLIKKGHIVRLTKADEFQHGRAPRHDGYLRSRCDRAVVPGQVTAGHGGSSRPRRRTTVEKGLREPWPRITCVQVTTALKRWSGLLSRALGGRATLKGARDVSGPVP